MKRTAILLAALLGGCTVGPNYRAPDVPLAPAFRAPAGPTVADAEPWWTSFHDPALNALETKALAGNLTIEQALARVDQANAALGGVKAARLPSATVDGSAARAEQSLNAGLGVISKYLPSYPRTVDNGQIGVSAGWDVDFAGGLRRQQQAALANATAAQAGVDAARAAVAAELADAYFAYRGAALQHRAYTEAVATLRDQVQIMAARLRLGAASAQALDTAKAQLDDAQAGLPQWQAARATEANRIAVLIAQSPSQDVAELTPDAPLPEAAAFGADTPAALLRNRPDLIVAEQRLIASNAQIGVALAEYYPKFSLAALLGFNSASFSTVFTGDSFNAQGALGLHWRLFDFKRIDAEVARARGAEREALAAYRDAVLRATEDVESGFVALDAAHARLTATLAKHAALADALTRARKAYAVGHTSRDALITSERAQILAESDVAAAKTAQARAVVAVHRALGR